MIHRITLDADEDHTLIYSSYQSRARTCERIEHDPSFRGDQTDKPLHQLLRLDSLTRWGEYSYSPHLLLSRAGRTAEDGMGSDPHEASYDLHVEKQAKQGPGIQLYWLWDPGPEKMPTRDNLLHPHLLPQLKTALSPNWG